VTADAAIWNWLAALLPEAEAQEVKDCWDIGEQEAGLGLLVSGILDHRVPISETVRVQISVLAETWGERETLTPRILQCRDDGTSGHLKLIEGDGSIVPEAYRWGRTGPGRSRPSPLDRVHEMWPGSDARPCPRKLGRSLLPGAALRHHDGEPSHRPAAVPCRLR
jgi:hypothetical protein